MHKEPFFNPKKFPRKIFGKWHECFLTRKIPRDIWLTSTFFLPQGFCEQPLFTPKKFPKKIS
jgi:hypothetical protein